jgi:hypothetical protein
MTTVPSAPLNVVAVPALASAVLTWTAPASNGGSTVTGYDVFIGTVAGEEMATYLSLSQDSVAYSNLHTDYATYANLFLSPVNGSPIVGLTYTATGLTNGTAYYFVVVAINAVGTSGPSAEVSAVPGFPTAPIIQPAFAGPSQVTVNWLPPRYNGGSAVTGYTITTYPGGATTGVGPSATSVVISGLSNRRAYFFQVKAINAIGTGPQSAQSNTVTPEGVPQPPVVSAVMGYDPKSGAPVITITVVADTTVTPADFTMTATILRNDGVYVIGAGPLNPLTVPNDTATAVIQDFAAPYGMSTTYVANITFSSPTPPITSPPSAPSAPVVMGQAPDTDILYDRMGWAQDKDESGQLHQWLSGVGQMMQYVDTLCRDGYDAGDNVAPGYSQLLDINRAPTSALPWLAQFVGVGLDDTENDDTQRYLIKNPPGFARGSVGAIIAAANQFMLPGYTITLTERDTSPYHLAISVPSQGIKGTSTCLSVSQQFSACSQLPGAFATCADLWRTDAEIAAAITAAIPAGIVSTVTYV